jgi:phosphatidylglycerophosphate synthase
MIDVAMRRAKDAVLKPVAKHIGKHVDPLTITLAAGAVGLLAAHAGFHGHDLAGLGLWLGNRVLDGLDGAVARASNKQSDLGGYIDTLVDFAMYTIIPFALVLRAPSVEALIVVAFLFGTFYINAGAFLYLSAILERRNQGANQRGELTSVTMPRGIIEGTEAIVFFCLFFLFPAHRLFLFTLLGVLVLATTAQHILWVSKNLR